MRFLLVLTFVGFGCNAGRAGPSMDPNDYKIADLPGFAYAGVTDGTDLYLFVHGALGTNFVLDVPLDGGTMHAALPAGNAPKALAPAGDRLFYTSGSSDPPPGNMTVISRNKATGSETTIVSGDNFNLLHVYGSKLYWTSGGTTVVRASLSGVIDRRLDAQQVVDFVVDDSSAYGNTYTANRNLVRLPLDGGPATELMQGDPGCLIRDQDALAVYDTCLSGGVQRVLKDGTGWTDTGIAFEDFVGAMAGGIVVRAAGSPPVTELRTFDGGTRVLGPRFSETIAHDDSRAYLSLYLNDGGFGLYALSVK
jgi:hypothetical protein